MKKKISLFTIIFVISSALIAILGLFGVLKLEDSVADLLFTCLTLSVAGLLSINSASILERKNKLAFVSLGLICTSALLVVVWLWSNVTSPSLFTKATLTLCILSVCFNLILSNTSKLQNKHIVLQTLSYICFIIVAIFLIDLSWEGTFLENNLKIFVLFIILSLLGLGILAVLSKKQANDLTPTLNYIKISKKEYEELLSIKEKYLELKETKHD